MSSELSIPLDLPDVRVVDIKTNKNGDYIITVESTVDYTHCHQCGQKISKPKGHDRAITLRHLPILGQAVYIRLHPKRFECPYCSNKARTTQPLAWYKPQSPHSQVYEEQV